MSPSQRTSRREPWFLGVDCSTQSLKFVLVDPQLRVQGETAVLYDSALPEFHTEGGAHRHPNGVTVTSPVLMWVAALERALEHVRREGWPLARIAALSGSGQQHGSVWWARGARSRLQRLHPSCPMRDQLTGLFALPDAPIWMDSSTRRECRRLERAFGGPQALAERTGSRAYERFTGNQIAKIWRTQPSVYGQTERISLVSSFMASLWRGDYAPMDLSDGSGMNLLDIRTHRWDRTALGVTAPNLARRLGRPVPAHTVLGSVHRFFQIRYGFSPSCLVVAFSGDNPCSLAGLRLMQAGDVAISLGTSDTLFASVTDPRPSGEEGHVFVNPVDPSAFMVMTVRKNGSLMRESFRDRLAGGQWERFNELLKSRPPGNEGCLGVYVQVPEITPPILRAGSYRVDGKGRRVQHFPPATEIRALVEGTFLSMRLHAERIGVRPARLVATGGASANQALLQVLADVFGLPVYVAEQANSAAVGAAYRALHGWQCQTQGRWVPFQEAVAEAPPFHVAARPHAAAHEAYTVLLPRLEVLEQDAARV